MIVTQGKTNVSAPHYFVDDVGGTAPGEPTAGMLFSDIETGGSASYQRQGAARVDLTLKTLSAADAVHDDGGFLLVDDTEMVGVCRCDWPDAAFVTGADFVILYLRAATAKNTVCQPLKVDLTTVDFRDTVRGGMTSLPASGSVVAAGPTKAEMDTAHGLLPVATDIVSGGAIDTTGGAVDVVTSNTDMRGTESASTLVATDILSGGVALATTGAVLDASTLVNIPTGSGDASESNQMLLLAALSGGTSLVRSNVLPGGHILLKQGDDHTEAANNEINLAVLDAGGTLAAEMNDGAVTAWGVGFRGRKNGSASDIVGTIVSVIYDTVDTTNIIMEVTAAAMDGKRTGPMDYDVKYAIGAAEVSPIGGDATLYRENTSTTTAK